MAIAIRRGFARSVPSKNDPSIRVPIRISDMTPTDASWWDARMRPHLRRVQGRADHNWRWRVLLPYSHLSQMRKLRYCRALVLLAPADNGMLVRVGMSIIIERYPHLDLREGGAANYLWFISAADPGVLSAYFRMSHPPALGRVLLDNAIVLSQNSGLAGKIGLHAAEKGGPALLDLYDRCGLLRLGVGNRLPGIVGRRSDGRYFYSDSRTGEQLARNLDPSR